MDRVRTSSYEIKSKAFLTVKINVDLGRFFVYDQY